MNFIKRNKLTAGLMILCAAIEKINEMTSKSSMLLRTSTAMQKKASFMGYRDSENAINRQSSNII